MKSSESISFPSREDLSSGTTRPFNGNLNHRYAGLGSIKASLANARQLPKQNPRALASMERVDVVSNPYLVSFKFLLLSLG
jgi:hypothetical protein